MEYIEFGNTGKMVSRIGFGGATAGLKNYIHAYDPKNPDDRKSVIDAVQKAVEMGINYFDTAPGYGEGQSEEIFGEALTGVDPNKLFLASKVPVWGEVDVRQSVESSLKRLKRDYIDLIQVHGTSYNEELHKNIMKKGGMLEQLQKLKEEGVIKHLGFTSEDQNPPVYDMIQSGQFDMVQLCYNLMFQHPYDPSRECGTIYEAKKQGMGISIMRPTTSMLFQKWVQMVNPENTFDYTPALIQLVLSNKLVDVVLIGMRNVQRVIENVAICEDMSGRIDIDVWHGRTV